MRFKKILAAIISSVMLLTFFTIPEISGKQESDNMTVSAASNLRRPINNQSPAWIVHIDSWNYPDPEKIIELVPEDILPYVIFNISLSINWDSTQHKWKMVQDGKECARSWMRACAAKGVWTMIQPASGGQCHFPDYKATDDLDNTIFGEFFKEYPNFLGYNYCEQFWGFSQPDFPVTFQQRYDHFSALLKLCNKYGGYLDISWCGNQWGQALNPIAMLKTNSNWEKACRAYAQNYILEEKYTQTGYISDVESQVYGMFLSGYCGNFGVRWDDTGWSDYPWNGSGDKKDQYRLSTSLPIYFERMAMNGMTVIDGPELVWNDCINGLWDATDSEGYKIRRWDFTKQCKNVNVDIMRKFMDGTIRIPDRNEAISRTKIAIIQDVSSGNDDSKYCSYPSLFEGLYRKSTDGNLRDNHDPFKSTGRYQTIPTIYGFADNAAKSIPVQVKQSQISSRWGTIAAKQEEFNKYYPGEAYANCFAERNENTWVTYNPNKTGSDAAGAELDLKYNTCKTLDIKHMLYGSAVINEYSDHIDLYMNNYDEDAAATLKTETITIKGAGVKPTFTYKDRGADQTASVLSDSWSGGVYTLTVKHNGPVDISIKCSGSETGKLTSFKNATRKAPAFPSAYSGKRQYEAENFDMKNVDGNVTNGCNSDVTKFHGMGFVKFGTKNTAAVRDTVYTSKEGTFKWTLRYSAPGNVNSTDLYVNGTKVKTLSLPGTSGYSDWKTIMETISLKKGDNKIEIRANAGSSVSLYLDEFTVEGDFGAGSDPVVIEPAEPLNGELIKNLIVNDTENAADWSIEPCFDTNALIFGDRNITAADVPAYLVGTELIRTACDSKMFTEDLCSFKASGNIVLYVALDERVVPAKPDWFKDWTDTGDTMTASGDLTFNIFKKEFRSGDSITLGKNGGNGANTNYLVFAGGKDIFTADRAYMLKNVNSGMYMDVSQDSNVCQSRAAVPTANNIWRIVPAGDGYYNIISAIEGGKKYALDIRGAGTDNGTNIGVYNLNSNDNQKFMLTMNADGSYKLHPKSSIDKIAEVGGASREDGANIQIWELTGSSCQNWDILSGKLGETAITVPAVTTTAVITTTTTTTSTVITTQAPAVTTKVEPQKLKGDVNGDKTVDLADLTMLAKWLTKKITVLADPEAADIDGSGTINIIDMMLLKSYMLGKYKLN